MKYSTSLKWIDAVAICFASLVVYIPFLTFNGEAAQRTGSTRCLENLRRMTMAWSLFSDDNEGELLRGNSQSLDSGDQNWFFGSMAGLPPGGSSFSNSQRSRTDIDPELITSRSPLFPYLSKETNRAIAFETFRCPADPSRGSHKDFREGKSSPRIRSYSINNWIGGQAWSNSGFGWKIYLKRSDITSPPPSKLMVFLGERADSINDTSLLIDMSGFQYGESPSRHTRIVDYPSFYHQGGASISFADGHVVLKKWKDRRTTPPYTSPGFLPLNLGSPSNPDVAWLQERASAPIN